jgi:hypothetical protein
MERIKSLREKTEAASYAEEIRNALRLCEALVKESENGNQLYIKDREGREVACRTIF